MLISNQKILVNLVHLIWYVCLIPMFFSWWTIVESGQIFCFCNRAQRQQASYMGTQEALVQSRVQPVLPSLVEASPWGRVSAAVGNLLFFARGEISLFLCCFGPDSAAPTSLMRAASSKKLGACRLVPPVAIRFSEALDGIHIFFDCLVEVFPE